MKFPKWQYLVLILLLAVLVRSPVLKSQFIYETYLGLEYLEKLPASEIFGIGRLTIPERKVDSAVPYGNFYFRPAIAVPMALGKWLGGYDPLALSMVGLAIHCINVALVCLLLTGSGWTAKRSLAATILFAVSPLNTLPIAFAGGYSFMLFAMFTMVSFIFFRRSLEGNRRCLDLFLSVGAYAVSALCLETCVVTPAVFLIFALGRFQGGSTRERFLRSLKTVSPFMFVSIPYLGMYARFFADYDVHFDRLAGVGLFDAARAAVMVIWTFVNNFSEYVLMDPLKAMQGATLHFGFGLALKGALFAAVLAVFLKSEERGMKWLVLAWMTLFHFPYWSFSHSYFYLSSIGFYCMAAVLVERMDMWGGRFERFKKPGTALFIAIVGINALYSYVSMERWSMKTIEDKNRYEEAADAIQKLHPSIGENAVFFIVLHDQLQKETVFNYAFRIPLLKRYAPKSGFDVEVVRNRLDREKYSKFNELYWMELVDGKVREVSRQYAEEHYLK